jgi:ParB family chromosome partitioning protein
MVKNEIITKIDYQRVKVVIGRCMTNPDSVSLEEIRSILMYYSNSDRTDREEAKTFEETIRCIDLEIEQAKDGDPAYQITENGTYRLLGGVRMVPLDTLKLKSNDLFHPMEGDDFEEFKNSIHKIGMLQPIVADQNGEVIIGRERCRAAKEIGRRIVPVLSHRESDSSKHLVLSIEENIRHRQLRPSEMARCISILIDIQSQQGSLKKVAGRVNLSERQVARYRDLSRLIPELQDLLDEGALKKEPAQQIATLDQNVQRALYEASGKRIVEGLGKDGAAKRFKEENAKLLEQIDRLAREGNEHQNRINTLTNQLKTLEQRVDTAESDAGREIKQRKKLEDEVQLTRVEMNNKLKEKEAIIQKLTRNVGIPQDYDALKERNRELQKTVEKLQSRTGQNQLPPDSAAEQLYDTVFVKILPVKTERFKEKLKLENIERLTILASQLEAWLQGLKESIKIHQSDKKGR